MGKSTDGRSPKIIGITGGIGSGKTVATDALKAACRCVIDADEISRAMFARGTVGERLLCSAFPQAATDGALDRAELRRTIAHDKAARIKLNELTHPVITAAIKDTIAESAESTIIISAPLLFESGLDALCDKIICVSCPLDKQIERIVRRDGVDEPTARAMTAAQMSDDERRNRSDVIINSDIPLDEFKTRVIEAVRQTEKNI